MARIPQARKWFASALALAAWIAALCCSALMAGAQEAPLEYAIEAAYLPKIAAFVDWPNNAAIPGVFTICVVGNDPFRSMLDQVTRGQIVAGRPIVVKRFPTISDNPGCQILFAAGSGAQSVDRILAAVRNTPVLTATNNEDDPSAKGIINFVVVNRHVRFEIDEAKASEHGLRVSSKLLSLAVNIGPGP